MFLKKVFKWVAFIRIIGHPGFDPKADKYLTVDNDGAVDVGAQKSVAEGIEVSLQGGGGIANGDAIVS